MNVIYEKRNSCENCKNFQQYYLKSYSRLVRAHCGRCLLRRASTNVAYVLPSHAACSAWENAEEQERLYNEKLMASLQDAINRLTGYYVHFKRQVASAKCGERRRLIFAINVRSNA